ncbi:distal tail protein Dit [Peribacillus butanolivorans]|uniref:distal tail protein Dit n=1 Tax=Peribacillus butanolivorans TaxID=421767 RepID=UPI003675C2AE
MKKFTFNGISKPYLTALKGSNRQPWAPIEWTYQDVPKRPGALPVKKNTRVRPLPIPVFLKAKSIEDLQKVKEDLAEWLIHDEPKPLIFDDEPDRIYYAVMDGSFDPDEILKWGQGVIPFTCPDPYKYGTEKKVNVTSSVTNEGTALANPIFTVNFTAKASEFKILHVESGKFIRVIYGFVAGDVLVIDFTKRKVTINNNLKMTALDFRSNWFSLQKGVNQFTITPSSVATTKLTYKPRWL